MPILRYTPKVFPALAAAALALMLYACNEKTHKIESMPFATHFDMEVGGKPFKAQVAVYDDEKARGLMFRRELEEDSGMFFIYDVPVQASFWMKNTLIPLDIGFFDADGTLTEVKSMYPNNLNSVRSSRSDIVYCLEMNAGWFKDNGVFPPAKLDMQKLKDAVEARKAK